MLGIYTMVWSCVPYIGMKYLKTVGKVEYRHFLDEIKFGKINFEKNMKNLKKHEKFWGQDTKR